MHLDETGAPMLRRQFRHDKYADAGAARGNFGVAIEPTM
jgi:hypothetical protein